MRPSEKFHVMTAAEFTNTGPRLGSREEKQIIAAEEWAKRDREQRRRERLARMTPAGIEHEQREFERCEQISQITWRLANKQDELDKERLPKWLQ